MPSALSRTSLSQAWRDLLYLSAALPIGVASFIVLITGLSVGIGTAIVMIGFPVLAVTLLLSHLGANIERERAALALGAPIARPARRATHDSLLKQLVAFLRDRATWKELAYLLLLGPLGTLLGTTALALWSAVVALVIAPAAAAVGAGRLAAGRSRLRLVAARPARRRRHRARRHRRDARRSPPGSARSPRRCSRPTSASSSWPA